MQDVVFGERDAAAFPVGAAFVRIAPVGVVNLPVRAAPDIRLVWEQRIERQHAPAAVPDDLGVGVPPQHMKSRNPCNIKGFWLFICS